MKCTNSLKELSFYLDGRCSEKKSKSLNAHIDNCAECKERLESLKLLKTSLKGLTPIEESSSFDFEFNALLNERLEEQHGHGWRINMEGALAKIREGVVYPMPVAVKVAASFLLVVGLFWGVKAQAVQKMPFIEFSAGKVKIYRPSEKAWLMPDINMRLMPGDKIEAQKGAILNIASRNRYKMRIKDKSLVVLSRLDNRWRSIDTSLSISYGNMLVNTTEQFKGSTMNIYTPACDAEVVGTAFMVKVFDNKTWLGVLEGKVRILSKVHPLKVKDAKKIATYISSGQKAFIKPYYYSTRPELFLEKEWRTMQELYQLQEGRDIMLLVGTGSDRVEKLFGPAPVYIPHVSKRSIPKQIRSLIDAITDATEAGDSPLVGRYTRELETLLRKYPAKSYGVQILMFVASHYHYIRDYSDALRVFNEVLGDYPDSHFASLAKCGIATIYQKDLKDIRRAEKAYKELLRVYPDSVDAIRAKESLSSLR